MIIFPTFQGFTSKSTTCRSSAKDLSLQKLRSKVAFLIRSFIFFSVILIFFIKFYAKRYFANSEIVNSAFSNYPTPIITFYGRVILSVTTDESIEDTTAYSEEVQKNCTESAINEFPSDGLTRFQRQHGWIAIHVIIAFYCFWFLAAICDDYFVPAIEQICATLKLKKDVIGATIMAAATSSPELFMNCIGTFVTKGDIGVGTIVGSAVFNVLAVPACCGFFVRQAVHLDWWPVTRDCLMYCVAILGLLGILRDGKVMWYEALFLVAGYFIYISVMYYNSKMARTARKIIMKYRRKLHQQHQYHEVAELTPLLWDANKQDNYSANNNLRKCKMSLDLHLAESGHEEVTSIEECASTSEDSVSTTESDLADEPWRREDRTVFEFLLRWPIIFLLWLTIPDSRRRPSWKYITILLSIAWLAGITYLVAYVITIIGDTLDIPDSILGLTILSAGMSVPEAVSSIIVTKQGQGAMGISNSIGSNTFDILLSLGLPWFIKAYFMPAHPNESWVLLNSAGLNYTIVILLATLFGLYIVFVANRFVLDVKIGVACSVMYVAFMLIASLIELNVFFDIDLPVCKD